MQPTITETSLIELSRLLEDKSCSSEELTLEFLRKIKASDKLYNSFITLTEDLALSQARAADARRADGRHTLVTGLPLAHKDIFCTQDILTTCASRMLADFKAPYDATVVGRFNAAGTVTLGKTNMDEFAMGSSNETSYFGSVSNPWDLARVPGGSSGGSAAAVAARLTPVATGTDTGGSIRQPASLCGISGLKPTYGRVSRFGMIAFASSLDQGGLFAQSAADISLLFGYMAGFDERDSTSAQREDAWLEAMAQGTLQAPDQPMRIGVPEEYLKQLSDDGLLVEAQREFAKLGHTLHSVSLPNTDMAIPTYYVLASAEASTNLSRYDGVRFGHRCEAPQDLHDLYERSRSEGFGDEVKRRILTGTYTLSVGYFDAYYIKAQKIRRLIAMDFERAFQDVDVLLTPTAPGPAFKKEQLLQDPVAMYQQDLFTVPTSLAGLPAISIPCGFSDNMPVGMQLIAPAFCEDRILRLAHAYQTETDWHLRHPTASETRES